MPPPGDEGTISLTGFDGQRFRACVVAAARAGRSVRIRRRASFHDASRLVPLAKLALSPQCGCASTVEGNIIGKEEQWAKLARVVEVARALWGNQ